MNTNKPSEFLNKISDPLLRQIYMIANNACNQSISSVYETAAHEICQLIRPIELGGSEYHGQYYIPKLPDDYMDSIDMMSPEAWEKWKKQAEDIAMKYINKFSFNDFKFKESPHTIHITDAAHQNSNVLLMIPDHLRIVTCSGIFSGEEAELRAQVADYQHTFYKDVVGMLVIPGVKPFKAKVQTVLLYPDARPIKYNLIFTEEE